jgi:hypothetical protein
MAMPKKATSAPPVSVLERRLQNPFGDGSPAVTLKEPGWVVHVINTQLKPGRYHDVVRNKGWVPVEPNDLDGAAEDYGFDVREGRIVRGERGVEVLMKMPEGEFKQIQMAKDRHNRRLVSPRTMKAAVVESAAGQYSDQAADYLNQNVTIKSERSPVPLDDVDTGNN